jgi:hypothetical protein
MRYAFFEVLIAADERLELTRGRSLLQERPLLARKADFQR